MEAGVSRQASQGASDMNSCIDESDLFFSAVAGPASRPNSENRNSSQSIFAVTHPDPDWSDDGDSDKESSQADAAACVEQSAAHFADSDSGIMHSALDQSLALFQSVTSPPNQFASSLLADENIMRSRSNSDTKPEDIVARQRGNSWKDEAPDPVLEASREEDDGGAESDGDGQAAETRPSEGGKEEGNGEAAAGGIDSEGAGRERRGLAEPLEQQKQQQEDGDHCPADSQPGGQEKGMLNSDGGEGKPTVCAGNAEVREDSFSSPADVDADDGPSDGEVLQVDRGEDSGGGTKGSEEAAADDNAVTEGRDVCDASVANEGGTSASACGPEEQSTVCCVLEQEQQLSCFREECDGDVDVGDLLCNEGGSSFDNAADGGILEGDGVGSMAHSAAHFTVDDDGSHCQRGDDFDVKPLLSSVAGGGSLMVQSLQKEGGFDDPSDGDTQQARDGEGEGEGEGEGDTDCARLSASGVGDVKREPADEGHGCSGHEAGGHGATEHSEGLCSRVRKELVSSQAVEEKEEGKQEKEESGDETPSIEELQARLFEAASVGDVDCISSVLSRGVVDVDAEAAGDDDGRLTALHAAAKGGHTGAVELLVDAGADCCLRDSSWCNALHHAAAAGHVEAAAVMLGKGDADMEAESRGGKTALHIAVEAAKVEMVQYLVTRASEETLNHQDQEMRSALHYASKDDAALEIARLLVEHGADTNVKDTDGMMPSDLAHAAGASPEMLSVLGGKESTCSGTAHAGAEAPTLGGNAACTTGGQMGSACDRGGVLSGVVFKDDYISGSGGTSHGGGGILAGLVEDYATNSTSGAATGLMSSISGGSGLEAGVLDCSLVHPHQDHNTCSPPKLRVDPHPVHNADSPPKLSFEAVDEGEAGTKDVVQSTENVVDNSSATTTAVRRVLEDTCPVGRVVTTSGDSPPFVSDPGGFDPEAADESGTTRDAVTSLGEAGETVRATSLHQGSHHCSSLLHAAALRGDALGVRDALSQGDDPNGGDAKGRTPLHCASLSQGLGAAEAVVMLLQAGADPALRDAQWYCALHYAAVGGRAAVIDALVEGGADLEQECRGGTTALHMASSEGHSEAVEVLLKTACADNVNHQDQEGRTPVHLACDSDRKAQIVGALVSAGGRADQADFGGRTPTEMASKAGLVRVLAALAGQPLPRSWARGGEGGGGMGESVVNEDLCKTVDLGRGAGSGVKLAKSVDEDIVTGRGEVWVARPADPAEEAKRGEASGVAVVVQANLASSSGWGTETVVLPPVSAPGAGRQHQGVGGGKAVGFARWEAQGAAAGSRQRAMAASVVDLGRSAGGGDEWIVVDEEEEAAKLAAAGGGPGVAGARSKGWGESVRSALAARAPEVVSEVKKNFKWTMESLAGISELLGGSGPPPSARERSNK